MSNSDDGMGGAMKDVNLEKMIYDELLQEFKEQHNEQLSAILFHPDVYKHLTRKEYKKIKRRLFYDVWYWNKENCRVAKYFESMKKVKNYVNYVHSWYDGMVEIEKSWCYRQHHPKHKTYYVSYRPNQFIVIERY
jgi:hypothetical protein